MSNESLRDPSGNYQFFKVFNNRKTIGHWSLGNWSFRKIVVGGIRLYQKTLSPDHSPFMKALFPHGYCKYHPSCSEYAKQAIEKKGLIISLPKTFWRLLRCNPWSGGGMDKP